LTRIGSLQDYFGLDDRIVLLCGATGGIGTAMADAFAAAGATLALVSDQSTELTSNAHRLRQDGVTVSTHVGDLRDADVCADLIATVIAEHGRIDVLVCNAGIPGPSGPSATVSDAAFDDTFAVNLRPAVRLTHRVAAHMAERGGGSIILTSSIAGLRGNKAIGVYGLTKAALAQLARNLAVEWGPSNVRANALAPGLIHTSWAGAILANPDATERRLQMTPLRRIGEPREVAAAALYLASPAGAFVTGHTLVVDGGTVISDGQ
jgi:NAD(P)-dependent dehydrogenase (short-subunit alcohol dehydrogenase family)